MQVDSRYLLQITKQIVTLEQKIIDLSTELEGRQLICQQYQRVQYEEDNKINELQIKIDNLEAFNCTLASQRTDSERELFDANKKLQTKIENLEHHIAMLETDTRGS